MDSSKTRGQQSLRWPTALITLHPPPPPSTPKRQAPVCFPVFTQKTYPACLPVCLPTKTTTQINANYKTGRKANFPPPSPRNGNKTWYIIIGLSSMPMPSATCVFLNHIHKMLFSGLTRTTTSAIATITTIATTTTTKPQNFNTMGREGQNRAGARAPFLKGKSAASLPFVASFFVCFVKFNPERFATREGRVVRGVQNGRG